MKNPFKGKPLNADEIADVLLHHRRTGGQYNEDECFIVCACGQKFKDGYQVDGNKAIRMHIALQIEKLQKP